MPRNDRPEEAGRREIVGGADRTMRAIVGPAILLLGYTKLGGSDGAVPGLLAMLGGALITETAITRVCPVNEALGVDTAGMPRLA